MAWAVASSPEVAVQLPELCPDWLVPLGLYLNSDRLKGSVAPAKIDEYALVAASASFVETAPLVRAVVVVVVVAAAAAAAAVVVVVVVVVETAPLVRAVVVVSAVVVFVLRVEHHLRFWLVQVDERVQEIYGHLGEAEEPVDFSFQDP